MYKDFNSSTLKLPVLLEMDGEFDVSILDFSPLEVQLLRLGSQEFKEFIYNSSEIIDDNPLVDYNYRFFLDIERNLRFESSMKYVVIPLNKLKKADNYDDLNYTLQLPYHVLQILSPSRMVILEQIEFEILENGKIIDSGSSRMYSVNTFEQYPQSKIAIHNIDHANKIINLFSKFKTSQPFKTSLESFLISFEMSYYSMQLVTLLISFESLINGDRELSYRLKRGITILCGKDIESCKNIFSNLGKCYALRSNIVHGEKYDPKLVHTYLPFLISLASRYLIELLSVAPISKEDLNKKFNEIGYGMQNSISQDSKNLIPNVDVYILVHSSVLK